MTGAKPTDLVLLNSAIYTVDAERSWAQALAIGGDRIAFVGTNDGAQDYIGSNTEVMNLNGKMVLPGFVESHAHPSSATNLILTANLHNLTSIESYRETIAAFAEQNPEMVAIRGAGWSNTHFPNNGPGKEILDRIVPDRPAYLRSSDGHSLWANSIALERCGITAATPDPEGGVIERDPETGEPTGTLREHAMDLVTRVLPGFTTDEYKQGLLHYQALAGEWGTTTALDAIVSDSITAYKTLEAKGRLTVRFRGSLLTNPELGPEQVAALVEERAKHTGPHFQTTSAKIFVDGVVEGETAYLLEPYAHRPDYRGELLWDLENLKRVSKALHKQGFQLHVHAIGDAATRDTLDAFEYAQAGSKRDARHMITHLQLVTPEDIRRFKTLGVVGLPQPYWFAKDDYYWNLQLPYLGKERADAEYPMQSMIEAGIVMASGSDFTVTVPANPLNAIQTGITRVHPGATTDPDAVLEPGESGVLWPEERSNLDDMIASFTINGAYANFLEHETGSLETGKLADIVVLDRNLFQIPVTEISQTAILMTLFEGKVVFLNPAFK